MEEKSVTVDGKLTVDGKQMDSKFRLVLVASGRAEQLMRGARPKLESGKRKPTRLALEELRSGLIEWGYGPPPKEEPAEEAPVEGQPAAEVH
jgi:DNA-directed RNA polymerase omega subunit